MADKSIMERIREYIAVCPFLDSTAPLTLDDITDGKRTYSIMSVPQSQPIPDVLGNLKITMSCEFGLREIVSDDKSRANNIRFLENFNHWIWENNYNGVYPDLPDGCTGLKIEVADSGYLMDTDAGRQTGVYISLLKFTYRKAKNYV